MQDHDNEKQRQQADTRQDQKEDNRGPVDTVRVGAVKGVIWEREGTNGMFQTATFSKSYRDQDGNVRDSNSFSSDDVLKLGVAARRTYDRMEEPRREQFRDQRKAQSQRRDPSRDTRSR